MRQITSLLLLMLSLSGFSQAPMPAKSAAEIEHMLRNLQVLGSVMYLAAHPDDENQRVIAYFDKGKGYRTSYLALTRGDGGQNLIGDEKGPLLGMLRTQELLGARRIDGGEQLFSRAYDFGYSKTHDETLEIWDKEKVLADVVWAIRKFRPDVIITRFATPEKGGGGHGHHTSSAILAHEAFDLANDPNAFPEQLKYVKPWQPKRLLWNNYWVFRRYEPTEEQLKDIVKINVGDYDPLLGKSYGEIADAARSMHKCQAFGAALIRGERFEYLELEKGDPLKGGLFDDIDVSWNRVRGGKNVGTLLADAYKNFKSSDPSLSVPSLVKAYKELSKLEGHYVELKKKELALTIAYCAGLWFEAQSEYPYMAIGDKSKIDVRYLKRSNYPVKLNMVEVCFGKGQEKIIIDEELSLNGKVANKSVEVSAEGSDVSQPYWLVKAQEKGLFNIDEQKLIGLPENPSAGEAIYIFEIDGEKIEYNTPIVHRYVDRAKGELYRPFVITPKLTVNVSEKVVVFAQTESREVDLRIKSFAADTKATISFEVPEGWSVNPPVLEMDFKNADEEQLKTVSVIPPDFASEGELRVVAEVNGKKTSYSQQIIEYDHIPTQMVFNPSTSKLVRVDLKKKGSKIGYIMGSGDEIPKSLVQMGFQVDLLEDDDITLDNIEKYDAIIAGIRAYNTNPRMPYHQNIILEYVKKGGNYVIQYNTTRGMSTQQPGPYPLTLSRDRVTVEEAKATFLAPEHPVLNRPNKISQKDFEGWIQERGLYFPAQWDDKYTPIISWNDPGETAKNGGLLVAKHGEGYFVYTGISFFRELPAGVPGAYRLFANLISL
ncbi:MAG: PIG-L family deacetylase [Bacteroidia bacterium]|nr:PIG-L family deacetylase [Bacteroidia bacterium]